MMSVKEQISIIEKQQKKAPIQTVPIANALGLKVYKTNEWDKNISGMIVKNKELGGLSGYAIFINNKHKLTRRRFTIAHEIGHFILHKNIIGDGITEDALLRANGLTGEIETQANNFAARLLMPWDLIKQYSNISITEMAKKFEVSNDTMSIRLLGIPYSNLLD